MLTGVRGHTGADASPKTLNVDQVQEKEKEHVVATQLQLMDAGNVHVDIMILSLNLVI